MLCVVVVVVLVVVVVVVVFRGRCRRHCRWCRCGHCSCCYCFVIFVAPADVVDDSTTAGILREQVCFVTCHCRRINTRTYVVDTSLEVAIAWLVSNKPDHHGILNTSN